MQPFPHPSDATHKIWSRLANWLQRYSSLKVWTTTTNDDLPLVYYKLTLWAFGSGELKTEVIKHLSQHLYSKFSVCDLLCWEWYHIKFWTSFYHHAKHESIHQRVHKNRHCKNLNTKFNTKILSLWPWPQSHVRGWGSYYIKFWTSIYHHIKHETNIPQGLETMRS